MAPKLMHDFPRAAMSLALKKGRCFVAQFLAKTYRDNQLQNFSAGTPPLLVLGLARIAGTDFRFRLFRHAGSG